MTGEPTLHYNDHGADGWVEYAQGLLNEAQAGPIEVDGWFGNGTIQAVYKFQQQKGLLVDGVLGDQTWAALRGDAAVAPHADSNAHEQTDHGLHVVFHAAHEDVYDVDSDTLLFVLENVGDQEVPANAYYLDVNVSGGTHGFKNLEIVMAKDVSAPAGQTLYAYFEHARDELGTGEFTWTGQIPSGLHLSSTEGKFTIN